MTEQEWLTTEDPQMMIYKTLSPTEGQQNKGRPYPTRWTLGEARFAKSIYDNHDFAAMPVLADALEEAGCQEEELLRHLRNPGPHVRGCWALDRVLGKE